MNINELTKEEKDEIFTAMVSGDYKHLEDLIIFFKPLMKKVYIQNVKGAFIISKEEFIQETSVILSKRIKNFFGYTLGQFLNFTTAIIKGAAKEIAKKYEKISYKYVSVEDMEVLRKMQAEAERMEGIDDQVVRKIRIQSIIEALYKILTVSEKITFKLMVKKVNLKKYADKKHKNYEKLRGERKRLVAKIRKNKEIRAAIISLGLKGAVS